MDVIKFVIDVLTAEGETGSTAYDIANVFVGPLVKIAEGASNLLSMFV